MKTYYGDPEEPMETLLTAPSPTTPPEVGDELCDGHQMHYIWDGKKWA